MGLASVGVRQQIAKALSDCVDVQADLRLCCSHVAKARFSHDMGQLYPFHLECLIRKYFTCLQSVLYCI